MTADLQERSGSRPLTNPCLPHAQKSDNPTKEVWNELCLLVFQSNIFEGANGPNRSMVSLPDSLALFMNDDCPCKNAFIGREWAHVHGESDGSLHLNLAEADAATIIRKGWGERHLMAGKKMSEKLTLPNGLVMIYAPRDSVEIKEVIKIMTASYHFARGDYIPFGFT